MALRRCDWSTVWIFRSRLQLAPLQVPWSVPGVVFRPRSAGTRSDGLHLLDPLGNPISNLLLSGTGLALLLLTIPGTISTMVGTGALSLPMLNPERVVVDPSGTIFVSDSVAAKVWKIAGGLVTVVAGNGFADFSGDGDLAIRAELNAPIGLSLNGAGDLFIADSGNNRIRKIDAVTGIITTVAGNGTTNSLSDLGDNKAAPSANLAAPNDVFVDSSGLVYIADTGHNRIRRIGLDGKISTVAGGGTPAAGSDGLGNGGFATAAVLSGPTGLAVDGNANLLISDTGNNLVRVVRSGIISVLAGNGSPTHSGDEGPALQASICSPKAIAADAAGQVYIADYCSHLVRLVDATGIIHRLAGSIGPLGPNDDARSALNAELDAPSGLAITANGSVIVLDQWNAVLRQINSAPSPIAFGTVPFGTVSTPASISLFDAGNASLTLSNVTIPPGYVQQATGSSDCLTGVMLPPGSNCVLAVACQPQTTGTSNAQLNISTNASLNGSLGIALSGNAPSTGSGALRLNAAAVNWGSQGVQTRSTESIFSLTNSTSSLVSLGFSLSGATALDFQINSTDSTCGSTLSPEPPAQSRPASILPE